MASIRERKAKDGTLRFTASVRMKGQAAETKTFRRLTDCRRWIASIESSIREGRYTRHSEAQRHTLKEAIEKYIRDELPKIKDYANRKGQLDRWVKELGDHRLSEIDQFMIADVRDLLLSETIRGGKKRSSPRVRRYLAALSHCYTIIIKNWGWVSVNPVSLITKPPESKHRTRFLSDDERQRLLASCKESNCDFLYLIIVLALVTGCRRNEIMSLRWQDVDLERCELTLIETKTAPVRIIPVTGRTLDLLREHSKIRRLDNDLLFPSKNFYGKDSRPHDIQSAWKRALTRAKIEDFRFHDLRHSAASALAMQGRSLREIGSLLGHSQQQTTMRYAHLHPSHLRGLTEDLDAKIFADDPGQTEGGGHEA